MSDRSASPAREEPQPKKQKTGGFKWKEKKPKDEDAANSRDSGRLERGYRDRSPRRDSYRDRRDYDGRRDNESRRDSERDRGGDRRYERYDRNKDDVRDRLDSYRPGADRDRRRDTDSFRPTNEDSKTSTSTPATNDTPPPPKDRDSKPKKDKSKKPKPVSNEPMIIVNINDRLGTKAAIPCLASDSVKAFKALVAAHIGRQPHEIMLKRQGERPFKDALTLADYGVSSGVQLDLELDTGD